jgi:hypothetical protein
MECLASLGNWGVGGRSRLLLPTAPATMKDRLPRAIASPDFMVIPSPVARESARPARTILARVTFPTGLVEMGGAILERPEAP